MQKRKPGKFSIFSPLDIIFDCLAGRVTRFNPSIRAGLRDVGMKIRPDGQSNQNLPLTLLALHLPLLCIKHVELYLVTNALHWLGVLL